MANTIKNLKGTFHHSFKNYKTNDDGTRTLRGIGAMYLVSGPQESIDAYLEICENVGYDMERLLDARSGKYKYWSNKSHGTGNITIQFNMEAVDEDGVITPYVFVKDEVETHLQGAYIDAKNQGNEHLAQAIADAQLKKLLANIGGQAPVTKVAPKVEESATPPANEETPMAKPDTKTGAKTKAKAKIDDLGKE
jgi:hypothetical protein